MTAKPDVAAFFDAATNTVTYLVADAQSGQAAVIDPVLDFDPASGVVATGSSDAVLAAADGRGWTVALILETHAHADHPSAARHVKARTGAPLGVGARIVEVQRVFAPRFGVTDLVSDGGDFDLLLRDGDRVSVGGLAVEVIATPGHTPACVSYRFGDALFVGDAMFMPDFGSPRCDFPGGDARALYASSRRLFALPDATRMFVGHDYKPPGRDAFAWETSVGAQRTSNAHLKEGIGEEEFVAMRQARDRTLAPPRLMMPSIQVNIRGGRLPPPDADGRRYLKLPVSGATGTLG
jgi:glyoxylase-like metal-dependent hydrolase (beta-lactamase superfamily II)